MIETLDGIIEELADRIQLYGFCKDHQEAPDDPFSPVSAALCKTCWKTSIKERLSRAFLVELNRAFIADQKTGGGGRIQ